MSSNAFAQLERDQNRRDEQIEQAREERARKPRGIYSTVCWIAVTDEFPDAEATVLVNIEGGSDPVWLGFTDGSEWFDACSGDNFAGRVTHWCEFPMGPTP